MSPITTHILDLSSGRPAKQVPVALAFLLEDGRWETLAVGLTDDDGRARGLLPEGTLLEAGTYQIEFHTYEYFHAMGVKAFHPMIVVPFVVEDPAAHYHVPLLLSPFGYSTYRGS